MFSSKVSGVVVVGWGLIAFPIIFQVILLVWGPYFENHSLIYTFNDSLALDFIVMTANYHSSHLIYPDTDPGIGTKPLQTDFGFPILNF